MKKILIFSLAYYPSFVSGAEAAVKEITDRTEDIEFHLVTLLFDKKAPRTERIGNVLVHRIGFGGGRISKILFIPMAALAAARLHRTYHFDALWSVMTYMLFPVVLARAFGVRAPHILTLQDGDSYEKVFERVFIRPVAPLLDYGFRSAAIVQVISKHLGAWPLRRGYRGEVVLIHNGANPKDIHDAVNPEEVGALKQKLGKKFEDVFLVNTARLVSQKGNDVTVHALTKLPAHIKLLLVGDGYEEEMLRELVQKLKLSDRVIFTGKVDRNDVTLYRRAADIFVGPSRSEGLGNAFLSAMASRLPVVTTQEGGLAEFVVGEENPEGQTAWVVPKDDSDAIVAAVLDILHNTKKVEEVTQRARAMVLREYDWDMIARQMQERVFAKVLSN